MPSWKQKPALSDAEPYDALIIDITILIRDQFIAFFNTKGLRHLEMKDSQVGSQPYVSDQIPIQIAGHNDLEAFLSGKTPCILS